MNSKYYSTLIFELSKNGRKGYTLPENEFPLYSIPSDFTRQTKTLLPEVDEAGSCVSIENRNTDALSSNLDEVSGNDLAVLNLTPDTKGLEL